MHAWWDFSYADVLPRNGREDSRRFRMNIVCSHQVKSLQLVWAIHWCVVCCVGLCLTYCMFTSSKIHTTGVINTLVCGLFCWIVPDLSQTRNWTWWSDEVCDNLGNTRYVIKEVKKVLLQCVNKFGKLITCVRKFGNICYIYIWMLGL